MAHGTQREKCGALCEVGWEVREGRGRNSFGSKDSLNLSYPTLKGGAGFDPWLEVILLSLLQILALSLL